MMRLVQGDVGSGKTIVSAYAALLALTAGYQVAVMAPTELLAEQHFRNFSAWFNGFETQVAYLTGQLKGNARKAVLQALEDGTAGIIIGTHALFQDSVNFHRLGLIIIDEQHRFGVHQRLALREKGQQGRHQAAPVSDDRHADSPHPGDAAIFRSGHIHYRRAAAGQKTDRYQRDSGRPARRCDRPD